MKQNTKPPFSEKKSDKDKNSNLCKNFTSNLNSIDKTQHEITCMTWVNNTQQDEILVGLKNGTFRTFSVNDKKYCDSLKYVSDDHASDKMIGIASYQDSILTAAESGKISKIVLEFLKLLKDTRTLIEN